MSDRNDRGSTSGRSHTVRRENCSPASGPFSQSRIDLGVGATGKTVYRWVTSAGEYLAREHQDEGWLGLDVHDLRRTWGMHLLEQGVLPSVVMDWGGWRSWETFRKHYLGEFSPRSLRRERGKVDFLEGDVDDDRAGGRHPAVGVSVPTREHLPRNGYS